MSKTQLQPMKGIDEEKEFLKKLESMKITTPAPKVDKKTVMFNLKGKIKTSSGILKFSRAERHQPMRNKCSGLKKRNEMKKRRRKSVRFAPMSTPVSGEKIENFEIMVICEKMDRNFHPFMKKEETIIEQNKVARELENFHL